MSDEQVHGHWDKEQQRYEDGEKSHPCVHAVDGPDWAGLREPVSWKERAIAAEAENEQFKAMLDDWENVGAPQWIASHRQEITEVRAERDAQEGQLMASRNRERMLQEHVRVLDRKLSTLAPELHALEQQKDAMTIEWGIALPGEPGFETPDRATAESFVRDYPEEEYSLVQRLVGPWTVVPEGDTNA